MGSVIEYQLPAYQIAKRWREVVLSTDKSKVAEFLDFLQNLKRRQVELLRSSVVNNVQRLKAQAYLREINYFERRAMDRLTLLGARDYIFARR